MIQPVVSQFCCSPVLLVQTQIGERINYLNSSCRCNVCYPCTENGSSCDLLPSCDMVE